jgi:5'-deoxynucleotidase YfbR-like HD superfamily hydrolase
MYDYILTYSKTKFYPLDPIKEDIKIEDIAHALSLMTRANGHFKQFYSVAQHTVNCCREARARGYSERVQLGCLLHDASESYISDLTRPVKKFLSEYFIIEEKLQGIIYDWFNLGDLSEEEIEMIRDIDDTLLYFEFEALMDYKLFDKFPSKTMEHDFSQKDFTIVEKEFLYEFDRLTGEKKSFSSVGVDGCKYGWVSVNIKDRDFEVEIFNSKKIYAQNTAAVTA